MSNILAALIIALALIWSTNATIEAWNEPLVEQWYTPNCGPT